MAEAINIVLPSAVISTLARQSAIKAIKERLRAQGVKLSHVSARDIGLWADAYFETNRQALIEQAIEIINKSPTFRKYYEREQRERAKLRRNAQPRKPCSNTAILVQKSGAE
jgi:hypothetical protein